jgi:class 3 adenylate cyclase
VPTPSHTFYARNGDTHLGYQLLGSGPVDLLQLGSGMFASVGSIDEEPHAARFDDRLASMCRIVRFDMRGVGMSDPLSEPPTVEDQSDDAIAVLDAAGVEQAVLFATMFSGPAALLTAMRAPDRVAGLILVNTTARFLADAGYPASIQNADELEELRKNITAPSTAADGDDEVSTGSFIMPSLNDDPRFREWWRRVGNQGASPRSAYLQWQPMFTLDLRADLHTIAAPTLVLHSPDEFVFRTSHAEYLVDHIPNAKLVMLPSLDRLLWGANAEFALDEIEEFLTGARTGVGRERTLATLVFTDIVDSTRTAAALGDHDWRARLDAHDVSVRGIIRRYGGREVNTTGDGFLAAFDSAASGVEAARAIVDAAPTDGVHVRAGVHTGECERRGDDLAGLAVHIAARVAALAGPDEVYVSRTVRDLVVGSRLAFASRGEHELKGVPDTWQLYVVER